MYCVIIISFVAVFLHSLHAERNITPSPAVCATFPNEEFVVDVARCQNTCEFYGRNYDCPNYYKPLGDCYCKNGFARLAEDGKCVSVKNNAVCVGKLPITRGDCNKPNEKFSNNVRMGVCDVSCRTYGCRRPYATYDNSQPGTPQFKWAPHCSCADNHRRLSNGNCVHLSDPQCVAEYQPSDARCNAIGQVYKVNAPCQPSCYGETYCPETGPTCVCPPDRLAYPYELGYSTVDNGYYTWHGTKMLDCIYEDQCPQTTAAPN